MTIPPFWSAAYDADEPEGSHRTGSQYVTARDLRIVAIGTLVLLVALAPVYQYYKRQSQRTLCAANMKAMFDAIGLYAVENNDRLPPAFAPDAVGAPMLIEGRPYTWVSLVQPKMSPRRNFVCPAARPDEAVQNAHPDSNRRTIPSTYGMTAGMSTQSLNLLTDPDRTVLLGETANFGAQDTYNPQPFVGADGQPVRQDGFVIGYDNSNEEPDDASLAVTRLAFYGTKEGRFAEAGEARHDGAIHILYVSGQLELVRAPAARVMHLGRDVTGLWRAR